MWPGSPRHRTTSCYCCHKAACASSCAAAPSRKVLCTAHPSPYTLPLPPPPPRSRGCCSASTAGAAPPACLRAWANTTRRESCCRRPGSGPSPRADRGSRTAPRSG
eukprot:scaffold44466_cov57-Phaeocystis_antarctica.AAC.1